MPKSIPRIEKLSEMHTESHSWQRNAFSPKKWFSMHAYFFLGLWWSEKKYVRIFLSIMAGLAFPYGDVWVEIGTQLNKWGILSVFWLFPPKKLIFKRICLQDLRKSALGLGRQDLSYFLTPEVLRGDFDTTPWLLMVSNREYGKKWRRDPNTQNEKSPDLFIFQKKYIKLWKLFF